MRPLFNFTSVDGMSTEDLTNILHTISVITMTRNTVGDIKVWDHLAGSANAFPKIRMTQIESPDLKRLSNICSGRVPLSLRNRGHGFTLLSKTQSWNLKTLKTVVLLLFP